MWDSDFCCCCNRSVTPTIQMDSKVSDGLICEEDSKVSDGLICEVIPLANVQVCTFHWLRLVCPTVSMLL